LQAPVRIRASIARQPEEQTKRQPPCAASLQRNMKQVVEPALGENYNAAERH
jgi:hypothetical protein